MIPRRLSTRPVLVYYLLALALASVIGPLRAALMPPAEPSTSPYQNLWDWMEERELYINLKNLLLYAIDGHPWAFLIFAFAGAPTIAALLTCLMLRGTQGVRALGARFRPWLRPSTRARATRAYLLLLAGYTAGIVIYVAVGRQTGTPAEMQQAWNHLGGGLGYAAFMVLIGMFLDEGGTLEELGWRGFALPQLQLRYSPLAAAVLLGVLWYAWHFPREIPELAQHVQTTAWWAGQAQFLVLVVLMSIVIAYFVNRTGGSVLPAIMIHGGANVWGKALFPPVHVDIDLRVPIFGVVAVFIILTAGSRLGLAPGERLSSALDGGEGEVGGPARS